MRLIDPEKCYCIAKAYHSDFEQNRANLNSLRELLDDCPTVDAVEVVHGKWEWKPQNEMIWQLKCSVCGREDGACEEYKYCPNCGAKMDGGNNNE